MAETGGNYSKNYSMTIDIDDFAVFDLTRQVIFISAARSEAGLVDALRRPMTYSAARQREEFVAFDEDDQVFHLKASQVDAIGPLAAGDILHDYLGRQYTVNVFELQTSDTRYHAVAKQTLEASLKLHLRFESTSGQVGVSDAPSTPPIVTPQNSLNFETGGRTGPSGRALSFGVAADDRILVNTIATDLTPLAVSFWYRDTSVVSGGTILDFGQLKITSNPGDRKIRLEQAFSVTNGIWECDTFGFTFSWKHFTIVYPRATSASVPKFWVDGIPSTFTVIQAPSGTLSTDAGSPRYIGNNAAANDPARGSLDEFRIYDATGLDFDNYLARALWLIGTIAPA